MLFLTQNGPISGHQPMQQSAPVQQHFIHSPGTIVVIEELDTHQGRNIDHYGDLFGLHPSPPSPNGELSISSGSTAIFDWMEGPGGGDGDLRRGGVSDVHYLRTSGYFDQTSVANAQSTTTGGIYGTNVGGGPNPYYQVRK